MSDDALPEAPARRRIGRCEVCEKEIEQTRLHVIWLPFTCSEECRIIRDAPIEESQKVRTESFEIASREHLLKNRLGSANLRSEMASGDYTLERLPALYRDRRVAGGVSNDRYEEIVTLIVDFVNVGPLARAAGVANILYLHGPKGTGKTMLLEAAVAHVVRERGEDATFTSHEDISAQVRRTFERDQTLDVNQSNEALMVASFQDVALLAIDDVGRRLTPTEWELNLLLRVVDERYRLHRPTIISSNLSVKELFEQWSNVEGVDARGKRTVELLCDRLADAKQAISVKMTGSSLRRDR